MLYDTFACTSFVEAERSGVKFMPSCAFNNLSLRSRNYSSSNYVHASCVVASYPSESLGRESTCMCTVVTFTFLDGPG